ncbi:MAG: MBL fold metallo-hydrolase [Deltaproteobacteria bacterium]|nr:MBL fold metallo-hydrolase [Deltaproteobacteria bacterium]
MNAYLLAGEEPVLISTGMRCHFEDTWTAIAQVLDPSTLRHIVVLHFESDECGALNEFLARAPRATALASMRTVMASLSDFAVRPVRGLGDGEVIVAGVHSLRVVEAPYVHAWDGIMLVEEQAQIVFSGDLFLQPGHAEPVIQNDRSSLSVQLYRTFYGTPPEVPLQRALDRVGASSPVLLAPGHGSVLGGNLVPYYRAYRQSVNALAALRPLTEATRERRSADDAPPRAPSLSREPS